MCSSASYHFIIFRRQLEDTSQLGIHEIIGFCIFPLVEMKNGHVIHELKLLAAGTEPHTIHPTSYDLHASQSRICCHCINQLRPLVTLQLHNFNTHLVPKRRNPS